MLKMDNKDKKLLILIFIGFIVMNIVRYLDKNLLEVILMCLLRDNLELNFYLDQWYKKKRMMIKE